MSIMDAVMAVLDTLGQRWHFVALEALGLALLPAGIILIRRGRLLTVGHLAVGALWLLAFAGQLLGDGLWGSSFIHYGIVIVASGLLLGPRGLALWTAVTSGSIMLTGISHTLGIISPAPFTPAASLPRAAEIAMSLAAAGGVMFALQRLQERLIGRLQAAHQDLEVEVEVRRTAEEAALGAAHAKERFLATMSHDLRTPINGILGATRLLESTHEPAEREKLLKLVSSSADLLLDLVNGVLDYSRMASEAIELESLPVDLSGLLSAVTAPLTIATADKGIELLVYVDPTLPKHIISDPTRLKQVVLNLASNAVKFTREGAVSVQATRVNRQQWRLSVSDTGIGIPEDAVEKLFTPFSQVDASTTRRFGGTGLGLAIVARILEQMDGEIAVDSTPGEGTTFTVSLPLEAAVAPAPEAAPQRASTQLRVLVVDDHPINRLVLARLLDNAGHTHEEVVNGVEALAAARQGGWDLVLMDCQMPEMDGYEATQAIRALPGGDDLPIIGLSANALAGDRERALEAGMDDYLTKPIVPEVLLAALQWWAHPDSAAS